MKDISDESVRGSQGAARPRGTRRMIYRSTGMGGEKYVLVTERKPRLEHRRVNRSHDDRPLAGTRHIDLRGRRGRCGLSRAQCSRARAPSLGAQRCYRLGRLARKSSVFELGDTQFNFRRNRIGPDVVRTTRLGRSGRDGCQYQGGQDRPGDDDRGSSQRRRSHLIPVRCLL